MSDRPIRVLHLTTELPTDPGASGGSTRQFQLLAALAAQGHDVTVVAPVFATQRRGDPVGALRDVGVRLVAAPRRASRLAEARAGLLRNPGLAPRAAVMPFYAMQTELLAVDMLRVVAGAMPSAPDVVVVEHDFCAALRERLPWHVPAVLTVHNVTADYYAQRAASARGLRRAAYRVESARAERFIGPLLERYARVVAMSDADAALLRARTSTPVEVVPNGTTIGPVVVAVQAHPTILFTGTMNHPPNREGILWFHAHVWPLVRRELPDARLLVVGRHPQAEVLALAERDRSVEVTGEVADMAPYFADATVVVAPLLSGGGTRLKILDAFAARRAVVATSLGAAGLDVQGGRHLLVADDGPGFASATVRLLTDARLRDEIAARGRRLVEERYGWGTLGTRLGEILRAVVDESTLGR